MNNTFSRKRPPRHWIPLICLYAGTRVREAAQLRVQDVQVVQGVHCFIVTESEDDELMSVKSGKPRQVPIHYELLRRGILTYVEELQVKGETRLFPMFKGHKMDGYGDAAGRWFRRVFREAIGLERGVHELRNTFITGLNEAGVVEAHINALAGHRMGLSTSLAVYAGALSMPTLKTALDKLPVNPGRK